MFASKSLVEHLVRGALGMGAFLAAAWVAPAHPWALLFLPLGLVALRGCPACWTIGLVQTLAAKISGQPRAGTCLDGSCRVRPFASATVAVDDDAASR